MAQEKINIFMCHPDDPNPRELINTQERNREVDANAIRKGKFNVSVGKFLQILNSHPEFEVYTKIFNTELNPGSWIEIIPQCEVIILVCCPALVYLTSDQADKHDKLKEQYTVMELKAIIGNTIVGSNIRIIPVIINTTSNNINMILPTNILACTHAIEIYIPDNLGDNEIWVSQRNPSIEHLIDIIQSIRDHSTPPSIDQLLDCQLNQVDQNLIMLFLDQFAFPYISHIFDDVLCLEDNILAMESHLQIAASTYTTVFDVLRFWLRGLDRSQRNDFTLFHSLSNLFACVGREDLIYQIKYQWNLYRYNVCADYTTNSIAREVAPIVPRPLKFHP